MDGRIFIPLKDIAGELKDIKILYEGKFNHGLFGKFECDGTDLAHAVENFYSQIGTRADVNGEPVLPVNFDHAGGENAGLIKGLYLANEELWANVWFTTDAADMIRERKYGWISPEFSEDYQDENGARHGFTVLGLALTNYPFLKKNQMAIALSDEDRLILTMPKESKQKQKENAMEKELREKLSLSEDDNVLEFVDGLLESDAKVKELSEEVEELKAYQLTAEKLEVKVAKFEETEKALNEKIEALKELAELGKKAQIELKEKEADSRVQKALEDKKITPAQVEAFKKLALNDSVMFDEIVGNATEVIDDEEVGSSGNEPEPETFEKACKEYATANKVSFNEAVKVISKDKPELFKKYRKSIGE